MPSRPASSAARLPRLRTPWGALRAAVRGARRPLAAAVGAVVLALGACADPTTAPASAAAGAPRAYLAPNPGTYAQLAAGANFNCAVTAGGDVACWGQNSVGQATPPAGLGGVSRVGTGFAHACAVGSDATVVACWGNNGDGRTTPPAGLSGVTQITAGTNYTCALVGGTGAGGTVTCWGSNFDGQSTPPAGLSGVTQISATFFHTCALVGDASAGGGTVTCWGSNNFGQASPPTGLSGVTQVAAGRSHSCALRVDGTVVCWGASDLGQLNVPPGLSGVTQISAHSGHTCAVVGDAGVGGTVTCWGSNAFDKASPPPGLSGVTRVAAGDAHTCALKASGAVTCWGSNALGQFGLTRVAPTATFTAPASVVAGQPFTLALTGAQIPGYPGVTTFTYAFDCGDGAGYVAGAEASRACPTSAAGPRAVQGKVIDQNDPTAATPYAGSVSVAPAGPTYAFGGFLAPVDAAPAVNVARAGSAIPVKFSLGADYGLAIFKPGYPRFTSSVCGGGTRAPVETTVSADTRAGLTYDAATGVYTYVWKTDRALAGQCGTLDLGLNDGSSASAIFQFTR